VVQPAPGQASYGAQEETRLAIRQLLVKDRVGALGNLAFNGDDRLSIFNIPRNNDVAIAKFHNRRWKQFSQLGRRYTQWLNWFDAHRNFMFGGVRLESYFNDNIPDGVAEDSHWVSAPDGLTLFQEAGL
jgi:hypothetical protein